jgi:integrase
MAAGARRGEIQYLKKTEVNLHTGTITKDDHKGICKKPGKNKKKKKPKEIDLNSLAVAILRHILTHPDIKSPDDCEWVIESHKRKGKPYNNLHKPKTRLLKRANITDFRIHDMHHTFTSMLFNSDTSLEILMDLLGHSDYKTTKGYAHRFKRKGQSQSEAVSEIMRQYLDLPLEGDKVVSIASARKR